jgi:integrase
MPRVPGSVPAHRAELLDAFCAYLEATGRHYALYREAARQFLVRWPDLASWAARPLADRLGGDVHYRPLVMFLMLHGHLHPGYDFLLARRKLPALWRELPHSPMATDIELFTTAAAELGFTERVRSGIASQVVARLLIQTGRPLAGLTENDFAEFAAACRERQQRDGTGWRHYSGAMHAARQVLFHLRILASPPPDAHCMLRQSFDQRMADVPDALRPSFVAYLERLTATHSRGTVTGTATRLAHFGRHLAAVDPGITSLAALDRKRHIETYLTAVARARSSRHGEPISASEKRGRVLAVSVLLNNITEWAWPEAPARQLVFRSDIPRLPRPLPRYLPPDADRRLAAALEDSPCRLAADALLLQRACGLRIGELTDLELDCVHEVAGQGAWLKVPLGKLDTERMVPLDDETVTLIDRIVAHRSPGQPIPHPRTGKPADFLLTHHGRRLSPEALRAELSRAASTAGIGHATPHQLRHTYATALVNAGVSLQSLMALLGHVSAEMSLRYGRLFDATVRAEYERALTLAKQQIGPLPATAPGGRTALPLIDGDWRHAPVIKARLAGGYCLRAEAQGACQYANICEHCPSFRSDASHLAVLSAQRVDARALAADAAARGWGSEADRHRRLADRLDALITQAQAG